jgi:hypothetical protein
MLLGLRNEPTRLRFGDDAWTLVSIEHSQAHPLFLDAEYKGAFLRTREKPTVLQPLGGTSFEKARKRRASTPPLLAPKTRGGEPPKIARLGVVGLRGRQCVRDVVARLLRRVVHEPKLSGPYPAPGGGEINVERPTSWREVTLVRYLRNTRDQLVHRRGPTRREPRTGNGEYRSYPADRRRDCDEGVYDECGSRGSAAGTSRSPDRNQDSISEGAQASLPRHLCSGNGERHMV